MYRFDPDKLWVPLDTLTLVDLPDFPIVDMFEDVAVILLKLRPAAFSA